MAQISKGAYLCAILLTYYSYIYGVCCHFEPLKLGTAASCFQQSVILAKANCLGHMHEGYNLICAMVVAF